MGRRMIAGVGSADTEAGEAVDEDVEITVAWGEEAYSPVQYQSFRSGSIVLRTRKRSDETIAEAHVRLMRELRLASQRQFDEQLQAFLDRVKVAAGRARGL